MALWQCFNEGSYELRIVDGGAGNLLLWAEILEPKLEKKRNRKDA